jgi:hypothetical protein
MAKKKNSKIRKSLKTVKQVKRAVKKAAKGDGRVSKKEIRQISKASVGTVNVKRISNLVKKADVKGPNRVRAIAKNARGKNKGNNPKGTSSNTPVAGGGSEIDTIPNVLEELDPGQRDQKIFNRVLGKGDPLTKKIQDYQDLYSGDSKSSKNYLKQLKDDALQRMKINPESYGRNKEGTLYNNLSMAEQYDKNRTRLMGNLEKPLTNYISSTSDRQGLNMFDSNKQLQFDKNKFKSFADTGNIGTLAREKARSLGTTNMGSSRATNTLQSISKVKKKTSSDLQSKFAQDLKFIV